MTDPSYGPPPPTGQPRPGPSENVTPPPLPPRHYAPAGYDPPPQDGHYPVQPQRRARKEPGLALLASFFLPGLGQMVNGEVTKGAMFMLGYFVSAVLLLVLIGFLLMPVLWIASMVDAYSSAKNWNIRYGLERWVE